MTDTSKLDSAASGKAKSLAFCLRQADPANLLSEQAIQHCTTTFCQTFTQWSVPLLGGEVDPRELVSRNTCCQGCGKELSKQTSCASTASLLDVNGVLCRMHIPLRCKTSDCRYYQTYLWHNYRVQNGRHDFAGSVRDMNCFMLSSSFGVTSSWLHQFHCRLLRQHASFVGEADVMFDQAQRQNQSHLLPKRLRHYISDAWFKWRLLWRMDSLDMSTSTVDINRSVDDLVQDIWEVLDTAFTSAAIAGAREAQMRCDVIMLDGNAKNRRTVCAAALAATSRCHMLGKVLRHNCPCTPKLGSQFCAQHNLSKAQDDADMKILNHRLPNSEQPELLLHVRELHGANREAWVAEKIVPDHVLAAYWRELGEGKLAQAAMRRDKKRQKRHAGSALATSSSSSLRSFADSTSLQLDSASNDLLAVSCSTHKETESCQRELAKTAGVLCVCLSSGLILMLREIFGSESLSQRYLCLSALKAALPECTTVVHDDACHLYKYSERRMGESAHAAALAPPALRFVCDAFHMAGHVDPWCRRVCDPRSAENSTVLEGVRTSACEFTFTWLSAYKHQTKHMNQFGFRFFLLELAWSHNRVILNGGYGFPDSSAN